ncbi:uncharacterized protein LOC141946734 isoform X1 [Strix uralensis]|uniref:uncharacterized protein LOC141946734 isoform X1 n=1 Tax=Strix uralensis TaxID=36305 RepID=UPI003DA773D2
MAEVILIKEVKVKADAGMEITVERGPTHKSEALIPGGIHRLPLCGDISPFSPIKLLAGCCLGGAVEQTLGSSKCWCIWKYSERWAGGRRPPTHPQNTPAGVTVTWLSWWLRRKNPFPVYKLGSVLCQLNAICCLEPLGAPACLSLAQPGFGIHCQV